MSVDHVVLEANGGALRLEREGTHDWWRFWLVSPDGTAIRLGAESLGAMIERFSRDQITARQVEGEIDGHNVANPMNMADPLCAFYSYEDNGFVVLVAQAHDGTMLEPRLLLSTDVLVQWGRRLAEALDIAAGDGAV